MSSRIPLPVLTAFLGAVLWLNKQQERKGVKPTTCAVTHFEMECQSSWKISHCPRSSVFILPVLLALDISSSSQYLSPSSPPPPHRGFSEELGQLVDSGAMTGEQGV